MPDDLIPLLIASLVATRVVVMLTAGARRDRAPYLALLVADVIALGIAHALGERGDAVGFVAGCAGVVLVLAPGLLDSLQGRAERRGPAGAKWAMRIARLRELLVPGRAATQQRRALEHLSRARSGDGERVREELASEAARTRDPERARQLQAEVVTVLLAAARRDEAIAHAERQLSPGDYERSPALTAAVAMALCESGRLREAAPLLVLLESQAAGRNLAAQPLLLGARLAFVAGAGLAAEIERLLQQRSTAAEIAPEERERLRAVAAAPSSAAIDEGVLAVARELAERLHEVGARASTPVRRRAPLTVGLIAANCAVAAAVYFLDLSKDELGLARAGALFRPAVLAGEWWRLGTAMFLHAGIFHLAANMYGLYLLGRATEELLGWHRVVIVYALSGLGGGLASLWADKGLSVGASGAIMGLLSSLTVIVFARRAQFHPVARRMLLGNLLFLGALQVFLGIELPMIDSAAHAGGFVAGLLVTAGVAPTRELSAAVRRALTGVALVIALAFIAVSLMQARRPLSQTLLLLPVAEVTTNGVRLHVPRDWTREPSGLLVDRYLGLDLHVEIVSGRIRLESHEAADPRVRPLLERISADARPE
jgi:membrane associated rhomboid family serine protease